MSEYASLNIIIALKIYILELIKYVIEIDPYSAKHDITNRKLTNESILSKMIKKYRNMKYNTKVYKLRK